MLSQGESAALLPLPLTSSCRPDPNSSLLTLPSDLALTPLLLTSPFDIALAALAFLVLGGRTWTPSLGDTYREAGVSGGARLSLEEEG